jgi:hypothetical protein
MSRSSEKLFPTGHSVMKYIPVKVRGREGYFAWRK